jgi:multiple sugar transport system permease protein
VLGLILFIFLPIIYSIYISFHQWDALNKKVFIGFQNYITMIRDDIYFESLLTTFKYVAIYVPAVFCLSLLLALFVNAIPGKAQQLYRSTLFISNTVSTVIAGLVWVFIYDPRGGYLNKLLSLIGVERQRFLASPDQALASVAVVGIWLIVGYNMVIFLSGLKDISRSYYEAAEIDGANPLQKFFSITFPLLKDTSLFILITTIIGSLQVFDQIRVMTNGGPGKATNVAVNYIYQVGFQEFRFGYASTLSVMLAVILMVITILQLKMFKIDD